MNAETFEDICKLLEATPQGIRSILREKGISCEHFYNFVNSCSETSLRYARAKDRQCDIVFDDMCDIADTEGDYNRGRLRVDTRKFYISKIKPKRYGDIQQIEITTEIKKVSDAMMKVLLQYVPEDKRTEATNAIITAMDFPAQV